MNEPARRRQHAGRRPLDRFNLLLAAALVILPAGCAFDTQAWRPPLDAVSGVDTLQLPERAPTPEEQEQAQTDLPSTLPATQPAAERPVTLADVREMALRHNLELEIVRLDPLIASEDLQSERAAFYAVFTTIATYSWLDQPVGGRVVGGQVVGSRIERASIVPGIAQPLRSGGTLEATLPLERLENETNFGDPDEPDTSYESDFRLQFTQPLAEGYGQDATALGIRLATAALGQAQVRRKLEVI